MAFLLGFLFEILADGLFDLAAALGWESLKHTLRREREASPFLVGGGSFLLGIIGGIVSLLLYAKRLTPTAAVPGVSLVLAPLGAGMIMHGLGARCDKRGRERPALFRFQAGAVCAFGMALARFIYINGLFP